MAATMSVHGQGKTLLLFKDQHPLSIIALVSGNRPSLQKTSKLKSTALDSVESTSNEADIVSFI